MPAHYGIVQLFLFIRYECSITKDMGRNANIRYKPWQYRLKCRMLS